MKSGVDKQQLWRHGFLCLLLALTSAQVRAEPDSQNLGEITVEDEQEEISLLRSSMPVSVINATRFHGRNISLNEVLKRVAGVRLAQEGGLGSRATVAIHGLEGQRVKIFIDGNPLNAPDGTFGINDIPIQLIERIEIYKGVVPARFGGDALAGAVNVVTRDFDGNWLDANLSLGSFNTQRFAGVLTKKWQEQGIQIGTGGFYNHADNNYVMNSPFVDGLQIKRDHDQFESYVVALTGKFEDRWFDEIHWELVRYRSMKEIQGIQYNIQQAKTESTVNLFALEFEKTDMFTKGLDFEYSLARPQLTLNYIDKAERCYTFSGSQRPCPGLGGETSGVPHDSADKQVELRHDLNLHYAINSHHALNIHWNSLDSEYKPRDALASKALGYDVGAFPSERTTRVTTLSYESSLFEDALVADMGLKSYDYDYTITSQERALSGTPKQTRSKGNETGFYVATRYSPLEGWYLKASYEEAYRLPGSSEVFGNGVTVTSSPQLRPEQGNSWNLGLLYDRLNVAGMPWLKVEGSYFNRDIKDMIKLVPARQQSQYVNLGQVLVEGFEVELKADLTDEWFVFANYTHQELTDDQRFVDGSGLTLNPTYGLDVPNVPKQLANLGVEYKRLGVFRGDAMLKLFWEANWVDEFFYGWQLSRYQDRKVDAQLSHTAGFEYSFYNDELILGFEVRNLTDEEITDVFNYPLMGRSYQLNLRYTWLQ